MEANLEQERIYQIDKEEPIDYKVLFFKFYRYWYIFAFTIIVAMIIAFLFNKYTKPVYEVNTTVLVKIDATMDAQDLIGMGFIGRQQQNIENEVGILKSYNLASRTINKLEFEVSYFKVENFISKELYNESPFTVVFDTNAPQPLDLKFHLTILSNNKFRLEAEAMEIGLYDYRTREVVEDIKIDALSLDQEFVFGEIIENEYFSFRVLLNSNFEPDIDIDRELYFQFNNMQALAKNFQALKIEPTEREASLLRISLEGSNVKKLVDFLNTLTLEYLARELEKKNKVARNTIEFINTELADIEDTLINTEQVLEDFRLNNEVMDMDFEAQQAFEFMKTLQDQKAELMVKSKYYASLRAYVEKHKEDLDKLVVPSSMGIEDPLLNQLSVTLISLYNQKTEMLTASSEKNPFVEELNLKIRNTRNALLENVSNIIQTSNIAIKDIDDRIAEIEIRIRRLPHTQRLLFGIEREFKLNNAIYTYLLQKRSEAQITEASNFPDNEVIDVAREEARAQVLPKKSLNYTIAILLGLILPIIYILGRDYFNDKIVERKDVENLTRLPIIGHVVHSTKLTNLVVAEAPKSSIAESFRSVRTNMQYILKNKEKQTILITSDMVSAGKTFIAINIASIYAFYGKKTLLMGFDLRKPKIYQDFELTNTEGISTYMIGKSSLDDIIQHSSIDNLDIIMAGPVPPNPAELIASAETDKLFEQLKEIYDFIIIDTPPGGPCYRCFPPDEAYRCQYLHRTPEFHQ